MASQRGIGRLAIMLTLLGGCAAAFVTVKVFQMTGVIVGSATPAVQGRRPPPTISLDEIIAAGADTDFHPDAAMIVRTGTITSSEGVTQFSSQVARGGRFRMAYAVDDELIETGISDGERVWYVDDRDRVTDADFAESIINGWTHEPHYIDAEAKGHEVTECRYRHDGLWVTVDTADGSTVEYRVTEPPNARVIFMRWTWPMINGQSLVEEVSYDDFLGVSPGQLVVMREQHARIISGFRVLDSMWRVTDCAVVDEIPDGHFTPPDTAERGRGPRW